jgi:hypothetical protein
VLRLLHVFNHCSAAVGPRCLFALLSLLNPELLKLVPASELSKVKVMNIWLTLN